LDEISKKYAGEDDILVNHANEPICKCYDKNNCVTYDLRNDYIDNIIV